jgi:hypothetical protein
VRSAATANSWKDTVIAVCISLLGAGLLAFFGVIAARTSQAVTNATVESRLSALELAVGEIKAGQAALPEAVAGRVVDKLRGDR